MPGFASGRQARFARRFLAAAARALFPQDTARRDSFSAAAAAMGAQLYAERADTLPDDASRDQESHRALVLASVRCAVELGVVRAEAIDVIGAVYRDISQAAPKNQFRLLLALAPNPLRVLQRLGMAESLRRMMGQDMLAKDDVGPDHYALVIEGCAYNDFFRRHGESDVTLVFCKADRAWMDVINRSKRSLTITRPSTQSTGAAQCVFRYENSASAVKPDIDAANVRRAADPQTGAGAAS
ncbi:MAG: L-2-amino-thiazoline-4-carboxylic acid hydrolase [Hyphomonadaceae bacterium]|nr:L-2-amino-thiazoline-4-carboxylic acid hydrolase [Hyphomonadaceae bacterium]